MSVAQKEKRQEKSDEQEEKRWDMSTKFPQPILINAPTGAGKTTFILDELVPFAQKRGRSILLLSNRHALNMQTRDILSKSVDSPAFSSNAIGAISGYDNLVVETYQSIDKTISKLKSDSAQKKFSLGYIVLDEIHFLASDALFNAQTSYIFTRILDTFPTCQRIYLSATPEEVKDIIAYEEYRLYHCYIHRNEYGPVLALGNPIKDISEYRFQPDYSYIKLNFCDGLNDLIPKIKASDGKWLIFVSKKSNGQDFADTLRKMGIEVFYVDADKRSTDSEISRKLRIMIQYEKFKEKVLISTSLLDNGISFHDSKLENIVVDSVDPIQVKQMIGRKRRDKDKNQSVNVYIVKHTQERIQKYLQDVRRKARLLEHYRDDPSKFIREEYPILSEAEHKLFEPVTNPHSDRFRLHVNGYAQYKLDCQMRNYEYLDGLLEMEGESAFEREVAGWFGIEDGNWTNVDGAEVEIREQVIAAINKYKLAPAETNSEKLKCLDKQLWDLVQSIVDKYKIKHDSESVGKGENIRNVLQALGLPYDIKKSKGIWEIIDKSTGMPPNQ